MMSRLTVQAPLTRLGEGPGLILVVPVIPTEDRANGRDTLDPEPMQKWAEEGFTVAQFEVEVTWQRDDELAVKWSPTELPRAVEALDNHEKCTNKDKYGLNFYLPGYDCELLKLEESYRIGAVVCNDYVEFQLVLHGDQTIPHVSHFAEKGETWKTPAVPMVFYNYSPVTSPFFLFPSHKSYSPASAAVAHTRSLTALKKALGGPYFDLEEIWEEHTRFEFEARSVEETMNTMVAEPYVNHVPTMTGGIGRQNLSIFYAMHFIHCNPKDTALELVSRTVGVDRVVDEFIFSFTHDRVIDWLAPGIPPTGKKLRIPFTAVVNIRGDRLYHEHIAWDQLTVLIQMGLMPEYLPFPYPLPDGQLEGVQLEYRVPGAGHEVADKLLDECSQPSNEMFQFSIRETGSGQDKRPTKRVRGG